ncbi:MAG: hypothetical protein JRI44_04580 [Deltaproteobacteria bacterium]|nr:hypothetical protein [Deltaproteobacteria bacterium]
MKIKNIYYHEGFEKEPLLILIHGYGASAKSWLDPYRETMGKGIIPFDLVLTDNRHPPDPFFFPFGKPIKNLSFSTPLRIMPNPPTGFWDFFKEKGYSLLTWDQSLPNGPIKIAVKELNIIMEFAKDKAKGKDIIFLAHSRGGLIARKYIQEKREFNTNVKALIMLSTPNYGSRLATMGNFLKTSTRFIEMLLPKELKEEKRLIIGGVEQFLNVFKDSAIEELSPDSSFIKELISNEEKEQDKDIEYFNIVGTSPIFTRLYRIIDKGKKKTEEILSILGVIEKMAPSFLLPDEIKEGKGDGMVAYVRAMIPWIEGTHQWKMEGVNHGTLLVDEKVKEKVLEVVCGKVSK